MQPADTHTCGGRLVTPTGNLPDARLEQILDRGIAADRITVDRGIAAGEFRFVPSGHRKQTLGIRIGHHDHATDAGLQVFSRHAFQIKLLLIGHEQRFDGLDVVMRADVVRQIGRIVLGTIG